MEKIMAYKQSRSELDHFRRQIEYDDSIVRQVFKSHRLVRAWFWWRMIIFLIDLYYINVCYLWMAFPEFYNESLTTLLPLNIIFLVLIYFNLVFKFMLTPKLPPAITHEMGKFRSVLLYLQHYLSYDLNGLSMLISVLFFISYVTPYEVAKYIHLVYALRLAQMQKLMKLVYKKIHTYKVLRIFYHIAMLFFFIFYLSHFFACVFYYIDQTLIQQQYFGDPSINPNLYYQMSSQSFTPIEMLTSSQRYIMALYFANGLVTTIAFGDIVGRNYIEDAYVMILQVLSTVVIAFLLQQFLIMLQDNSFAIFDIVKKFRYLRMLMRVKRVSKKLQIKIRNYLFYLEYYNKFNNPSQIVQKLSFKMQLDIYYQAYGDSMKKLFHPLGFRHIKVLCKQLEEITYQPEREIFLPEPKTKVELINKDHMIDLSILKPSLIYLLKGKMFQYLRWQDTSKQFQVRKNKTFFNAFQFFTSTHVRFGLRSKTMIRALTLSPEKLQQLLDEDELLQKQMKELKEQILSNSRTREKFQDDCQVCDHNDHSILSCPQIHYVVDETIENAWKIKEVLMHFKNFRKQKKRSSIKSKKQLNLLHFSVVLGKLNFADLFQRQTSNLDAEQDLGASLLLRMINSLSDGPLKPQNDEEKRQTTVYDENGLRLIWSLQQNVS